MRLAAFFAIVTTALALVPAGAHLFALPNKIEMDEQSYFIAQQIYRGWALLGAFLFAAIGANLALALTARGRPPASGLALAAAVLLCVNLAIFFVWTYPANRLTGNWTTVPTGWEQLRTRWEYSHAANAGVTFAALCCVVLAALSSRGRRIA